jgi:uncharacterized membrane protein YdjX (TVP38/TMEM64 family)
MAESRRFPLRLLAAGSVVLLLALGALFLPIGQLLQAFQAWSEEVGPVAVLAYVLLFVAASLLCLPAAPFSLGAGFHAAWPVGCPSRWLPLPLPPQALS